MPDYNHTLQLPQTDFSMKANLANREGEAFAENKSVYKALIDKNAGKPKFILHDGPPYANGNIHLGTALNKVLKDIVIRYKNMAGFDAPYVPGWDTHGLPIELKAIKSGKAKSLDPLTVRKICREYALKFVDTQREQFLRLGVIGDFDNPYLTLKPEFEAKQIEIFGQMAKKGYIYKWMKPVYWCVDCGTAMAEAEIEYENDPCDSVYVKFAVTDDNGVFAAKGINPSDVNFVIWTTTTWTLPGNLAICLGPNYEYSLVKANGEILVLATELIAPTLAAAGITDYEVVATYKGSELELIKTAHPFLDRESLVINGTHVTLESGTGCVHTAPGHGVDDFNVCRNYKQLGIVVPVDANGILTDEAGQFSGLGTEEANAAIAKHLVDTGAMLATQKITHQYPHCWRCKKPVLFRATEQWFCSVEKFRDQAIAAVDTVNWIPAWGRDRIANMIEGRSDWCISRQRVWGVPIPILYCKDCGEAIIDDTTIGAISALFAEKGSDAWWAEQPSDFLPSDYCCPKCGHKEFEKETDIMDVWFDSGVSHEAVLGTRDNLSAPADLYLEGADQYRGWFQSSLLTSVAALNRSPYKAVCTHGWVVDGDGRKMSKSVGNGIEPSEIVKEYGADILRLWVASSDYHADIRISKDILKQLTEGYRKIRNTARFILGNLSDFDPKTDSTADYEELDKFILSELDKLVVKVKDAYEALDFHVIYHSVHAFCVVMLSNFYLDIIKDRLYCDEKGGTSRRAAQTTIHTILSVITRLFAPILAFTSNEIWTAMGGSEHVLLADFPALSNQKVDSDKWQKLVEIRSTVQSVLEEARRNKEIGSSLEAKVLLTADVPDGVTAEQLAELFIVSEVKIVGSGETSATIESPTGEKCERCWKYAKLDENGLCPRCADVVKGFEL